MQHNEAPDTFSVKYAPRLGGTQQLCGYVGVSREILTGSGFLWLITMDFSGR
jgi:hypothetical protein